jgi:hypothetical protein
MPSLGRFTTVDPLRWEDAHPSQSRGALTGTAFGLESSLWLEVNRLREVLGLLRRGMAVSGRAVRPTQSWSSYGIAKNAPSRLTDPLGLQTCEEQRDDELETAEWMLGEMRRIADEWEARAMQECTDWCRRHCPTVPGDFWYHACVFGCQVAVSAGADIARAACFLYYTVSTALAHARYLACKAFEPIMDDLAEIIRELELMLEDLRQQIRQLLASPA